MSKKSNKVKITKRQIVNSICITILSLCLIGGVIGFTVLQDILNNSTIASGIDGLEASNSSRIYDSKGKLITTLSGDSGVRENVKFSQLPQCVIDAFLSVEDSRFYSHNGFDLPRFVSSAINNLASGGLNQGGSTLTMQLVDTALFKNVGTKQSASDRIKQKVQEIFKSMEIEGKLSKEKILENYLNQINFGGSARGIQKGANYYFGKNVEELNLSEAAFLAGVINAPQIYNPYNVGDENNPNTKQFYANAVSRRNEVLRLMNYHGYITDKEYKLAKSTELAFQLNGETNFETNEYKGFIDYVVKEVKNKTGENPYTTPMDIYTTMDRDAQQLSDDMCNGKYISYPDERFQTGFATMNNQTGAILALGAGRSYDGNRNRAFVDTHQPGSISKPLVDYAPAFEYLGYSTGQTVQDKRIPYGDDVLYNFDKKFRGPVTLKYALGHSLNTTAYTACVDTVKKIGEDKLISLLQDMGLDINKDNWSYAMTIGGGDFYTTPLKMAGAYSTFANKGVYTEPYAVEKIDFQDSRREDYKHSSVTKKVFSEETAWLMSYMLDDVVRGDYQSLASVLRDKYTVYAKTGTSSYEKEAKQYGYPEGIAKDKWIAAYTNKYTVACWAGYDGPVIGQPNYLDERKLFANVEGNIANKMLDLLVNKDGTTNTAIKQPSGVVKVNLVRGTNNIANYNSGVTGYINKKFLDQYKSVDLPKLETPDSISVKENKDQTITIKVPSCSEVDPKYGAVNTIAEVYLNDSKLATYTVQGDELVVPISGEEGDKVKVKAFYQYAAYNECSDSVSDNITLKYGQPKQYIVGTDFNTLFGTDYKTSKNNVENYLKTNFPEIYKNHQFVIQKSQNPSLTNGQFDSTSSSIYPGMVIEKGDTKYYIVICDNESEE